MTPSRLGLGVSVTAACGDAVLAQQLDAHQHGHVLVHGVVAVVDVGAAVLAELDLEGDLARRPQAPDVLAHQVGDRTAVITGETFELLQNPFLAFCRLPRA